MTWRLPDRTIFICIECLDYDFLVECSAPNILSLDPHPALSWGATSRASIACLLAGIIPECKYSNCHHNQIRHKIANPFFLTDLKRRGVPLFLYCANGWGMELIYPFASRDIWKLLVKQNEQGFDDAELVEDFLSREPEKMDKYFAYFHFMTTHPPFWDGRVGDPIRWEANARKEAVEFIDKLIKPLTKLDCSLVATSDHHIDHDVHHNRILDVFIATKGFEEVLL
jgi:hypothetical protein